MGLNESRVGRILKGRVAYRYYTKVDGTVARYPQNVHAIKYELAVALARAMEIDPVEMGL